MKTRWGRFVESAGRTRLDRSLHRRLILQGCRRDDGSAFGAAVVRCPQIVPAAAAMAGQRAAA